MKTPLAIAFAFGLAFGAVVWIVAGRVAGVAAFIAAVVAGVLWAVLARNRRDLRELERVLSSSTHDAHRDESPDPPG